MRTLSAFFPLVSVFAVLLTAAASIPPPLFGPAKVLDGDTLEVAGRKVRLIGIDAPEGKQVCQRDGRPWRCGDEAREALRGLIEAANKEVRCEVLGKDRWSRALGVCRAGNSDVGRELVRRGLAVAYYPKRGVRGPVYEAEEADAEAAQRGLWGGAFIRPSEWRKGER
jgi:endonuclease YncB( thermonuclease family)